MSWWVGKDRDGFNVALKEHTDEVMRRKLGGVPKSVVIPADPPPTKSVVVAPAVVVTPTHKCERCQSEFVPTIGASGRFCSRACYERPHQRQSRPWKPGSRGRTPKSVATIMAMARAYKSAIDRHPEAQSHRVMGRAAVVMIVGFIFKQNIEWIVAFTGYQQDEVQAIAKRLRDSGTWCGDGTIACEWGEAMFTSDKLTKRQQYESDVAFWLDALAATGEIRRETRNGQFFYSAA